MILTEDEKALCPLEATEELGRVPLVSNAAENTWTPSCQSSESQSSKEAMDSPAKKQQKNRVKLAANFSLAPVTKL